MHWRSEQLEEWYCQVVTADEVLVGPLLVGALRISLSREFGWH